jgi:hypothetical protein
MKPTPFGTEAANDDKLLWRITHAPYGISLDKADRIRAYMARYRRMNPRRVHDHPSCNRGASVLAE